MERGILNFNHAKEIIDKKISSISFCLIWLQPPPPPPVHLACLCNLTGVCYKNNEVQKRRPKMDTSVGYKKLNLIHRLALCYVKKLCIAVHSFAIFDNQGICHLTAITAVHLFQSLFSLCISYSLPLLADRRWREEPKKTTAKKPRVSLDISSTFTEV
jgi:hypothetical protein